MQFLRFTVEYLGHFVSVAHRILQVCEILYRFKTVSCDVMLQLRKNDLLSLDDDDVEVGSLPPPQMTIDVTSSDVLQLTITKTSLEVFSNLAQVSLSLTSIMLYTGVK